MSVAEQYVDDNNFQYDREDLGLDDILCRESFTEDENYYSYLPPASDARLTDVLGHVTLQEFLEDEGEGSGVASDSITSDDNVMILQNESQSGQSAMEDAAVDMGYQEICAFDNSLENAIKSEEVVQQNGYNPITILPQSLPFPQNTVQDMDISHLPLNSHNINNVTSPPIDHTYVGNSSSVSHQHETNGITVIPQNEIRPNNLFSKLGTNSSENITIKTEFPETESLNIYQGDNSKEFVRESNNNFSAFEQNKFSYSNGQVIKQEGNIPSQLPVLGAQSHSGFPPSAVPMKSILRLDSNTRSTDLPFTHNVPSNGYTMKPQIVMPKYVTANNQVNKPVTGSGKTTTVKYLIPVKVQAHPDNATGHVVSPGSHVLLPTFKLKENGQAVASEMPINHNGVTQQPLRVLQVQPDATSQISNTSPEMYKLAHARSLLAASLASSASTTSSSQRIMPPPIFRAAPASRFNALPARRNGARVSQTDGLTDKQRQAHANHFVCAMCKQAFALNRILLRSGGLYVQGRPQYCINCYEGVRAQND